MLGSAHETGVRDVRPTATGPSFNIDAPPETACDHPSSIAQRGFHRASSRPAGETPRSRMTLVAITRAVSPALTDCELTHLERQPIDIARATAQHASYEDALRSLGIIVLRAPAAPEQPDSVFVEDIALVLDEIAIITRPGAPARRGEVAGVRETLAPYRPLLEMPAPATLDGGDVIRVGRRLIVGLSGRTNREGIDWLAVALAPYGYAVSAQEFSGCLHLKSAATAIDDETILLNPAWLPPAGIREFDCVSVDPDEPFAANALRAGHTLLHGAQFPKTRARLLARGLDVLPVDCTELAKAEGAVTCCSILFHAHTA